MEARDRELGAAGGGAGGERQQGDAGRQVVAQKGVEQPLRLERDDAGAGGGEGARPVAGVGADVEGEVARARRCRGRSGRVGRCARGAPR